MDLIFGYLAGLLTLINPCVLPVLPLVLTSAIQQHRLGPVALAGGMSVSFVTLGLAVTALGPALGISPEDIARAGAVAMVAFGLVLLVPRAGAVFAGATAGLSAAADARIDGVRTHGLAGQAATGALLGAVWSPCIGPTLGSAIALASQGQSLGLAAAIMTAFALGVATVILTLAYGARAALMRRRDLMRRIATTARPVLGIVLVAVGAALFFNLHHVVEAWAVENLPAWLIDFSVSL